MDGAKSWWWWWQWSLDQTVEWGCGKHEFLLSLTHFPHHFPSARPLQWIRLTECLHKVFNQRRSSSPGPESAIRRRSCVFLLWLWHSILILPCAVFIIPYGRSTRPARLAVDFTLRLVLTWCGLGWGKRGTRNYSGTVVGVRDVSDKRSIWCWRWKRLERYNLSTTVYRYCWPPALRHTVLLLIFPGP